MRKGLKKCVAIIITIAMLVSVLSVSFVASAAGDTVTINGQEFKVGDTIEVTKEITINDHWMLDSQVRVPYDHTVLKLVKETDEVMFPMLADHGLIWNDNGSEIIITASDPQGIDFTSGGVLYTLKFSVIGGSDNAVTIDENLEEISTFPFQGDPSSDENKDKTIDPDDIIFVTDRHGNIDTSKGSEKPATVGDANKALTVNDVEVNVGDVITISKKIQVNNNWLMCGQFTINYDPEYLQFTPSDSKEEMFPNINSYLEYNDVKDADGKSTGEIIVAFTYFEKGYDFTTEKYLYVLPFTVVKGSNDAQNVTDTLDVMCSYNFPGDPATAGNDDKTMVSVLDPDTKEIAEDKGTSQTDPVVNDVAAGEKIIINGEEYSHGDKINHYYEVQDNRWIANGQFEVIYKSDILDFIVDSASYPAVEAAGISVTENVYDNQDGTKSILFNFTAAAGGPKGIDVATAAKLFNFYFVVKDDAPAGEYTIDTNIIEMYVYTTEGEPAEFDDILMKNAVDGDTVNIGSSIIVTELSKMDIDMLQELIEKAEAIDTTGYTEDSAQALADAIAQGKAAINNPTEESVSAAIEALETAIEGLTVDTAALEALVAQAEAIDTTVYTEATAQALADAITKANEALAAPTVDGVKEAAEALQAAIDGLAVDTTDLEALVAQAEAIDTTGYTEATAKALADAIAKANEALAAPTVDGVKEAAEALQAAIDGLTVDTAGLTALIEKANLVLENKDKYVQDAIEALETALANAEAVLESPTVENVNAQIEALSEALVNVKPITDELEKAIDSGLEKLQSDEHYSPTSLNALSKKIEAGSDLLDAIKFDTAFVSYEEVEAATAAIYDAIDNLVTGVLLGNANRDDRTNINDATWIQKYLVKIIEESNIDKLAADVNKDKKITILDATALQIRLASNDDDEYVFPDEI